MNLDLSELEKNVQLTVNLASVKNSFIIQRVAATNLVQKKEESEFIKP